MSYEVNKYALDLNGTTYLSNNNLDVTQDFAIACILEIPTLTTIESIIGFYTLTDGSSLSFRFRTSGYLEFTGGVGVSSNKPNAQIDVSSYIGETIIVVGRQVNNKLSLMVKGVINTDNTKTTTYTTLTVPYKIGAGYTDYFGGLQGEQYYTKVMLEYLEIQDTLTDFQLLEFANLDKLSDHSDYATFNKNAYYNFDTQTTDDQSGGNDATVTGVEQYAIIGTETVYGTKCTKTETFTQDASITFDELIYDWFYGGSIKIKVDNLAWKTIKILAYDDESNSYLPIKVETTTLREHTIVIPKTATRRLKLSIDSDSTFTKVIYTLESVFDVINDTDSNSSGAVAIDYNVIYSDVNIEKRSMSFRVNDDDAHFAQSILQNKVYLDDEIHQITSLQVSELDVNRKEFKCDFLRLLNE